MFKPFRELLIIISLLYFLVYGLLIPLFLIFGLYLNSDLLVDDQGLRIKFFNKFLLINWGDILEVKSVISFGLLKLTNQKIVVTKSKLSFVHRIYGLVYGGTFRPSFIITPSISDYSRLIEKISHQARINQHAIAKSGSKTY